MNLTTTPLNSTSFSVAWQPVPPEHVHGIVLGYEILLETMGNAILLTTEIVNVSQTEIVLRGPSEVSRFCVRVLAFTSKGDGKKSDCIEGLTWSEGEILQESMLGLKGNLYSYDRLTFNCLK